MRKRLNNIWNKEKTIDVPDCNLKFFKLFLSLLFYRVYLWFFVNLMDDAQGWFSLKHRQGLLPIICQFNNGPDWFEFFFAGNWESIVLIWSRSMHSIQGWGPIVNRQHILAAQVAKTYDLLAHDNLWKKRLHSMQVKVVDWLRDVLCNSP